LIEHDDVKGFSGRGFSHFENSLREEGYQLGDLTIDHILVDYRVPFREFRYRDSSVIPPEERGDQYRYVSKIRWGASSAGNITGYGEKARPDEIRKFAGWYTKDEVWKPPYFVITQPELAPEIRTTFEELGSEVRPVEKKQS